MAQTPARILLLALVLFTALTAVMTYPQVLHLRDGVHDEGDPLLNTWALAWVAHQLPRAPAHLFDANIFAPERRTLAFSETLVAPGLIAAPLQWLGAGPILVSNLVLLSGFIVSGAGVALLVATLTGQTAAGTLAGIVFAFVPYRFENYPQLQLQQTHVLRLESRPSNIEGRGRISIRDLVANSLRMRPDRIIVGECRRDEALDMLQAMNTGHEGSMTTLHSNSPRDTIRRLETLVTMGELQIPMRAIREQISSAIHLIVHQERMNDGSRKVTSITEVLGMEGEVVNTQQLFAFEQTGMENGRVVGRLRATGVRPTFADRFELANIHLHPSVLGFGQHR